MEAETMSEWTAAEISRAVFEYGIQGVVAVIAEHISNEEGWDGLAFVKSCVSGMTQDDVDREMVYCGMTKNARLESKR